MGVTTPFSACLTTPGLVMAWAPLPDREFAYSSASLALATIVQACIAGPFYPKAIKALVFSRVIARSRCSPADKRSYIEALQIRPKSSKQRKPIVIFIGYGTNDAAALAQATIGVHM